MSWRVRPARAEDLDALYGFAQLTGGGMTNLPNDRDALARRMAHSVASYTKPITAPDDELYLLVLEERATGRVMGTCALFSRLGAKWPFYNYKLTQMDQFARALDRKIYATVLYLATDLSGMSEVGGLFIHPEARASGVSSLLARSRYLFLAQNRALFCDRVVAEIRGCIDDDGEAPFWSAIGAKFFLMNFKDADHYNALHGNQFISDLMPKHPIYVPLLPEAAQAVIAKPHPHSAPARRMLEREGFRYEGYIDIFDGGPALGVETDAIATLAASRVAPYAGPLTDQTAHETLLLSTGTRADFCAWSDHGAVIDGGLYLRDAHAAPAIGTPIRFSPMAYAPHDHGVL